MKFFRFELINRIVSMIILMTFVLSLEPYAVSIYAEELVSIWSTKSQANAALAESSGQVSVPNKASVPVEHRSAESVTQKTIADVQTKVPVLARTVAHITPEEGGTIELGAMKLEIPPHAIDSAIDISLEELGTVANLNSGMENTTKRVAGYRALPHGTTFHQFVKITVPYDTAIVDTPAKRDALASYFYDETRKVWTKLERVRLDEENGMIESVTTHFTDFITATLKLPDSPKPLGFNPTSIKDIKAADPSAGIPKLEGLEANQSGSATFQIPLRLPTGRAGMMPQLALSYNSGGSSGWLGQGFDINVPSISIDTRKHLATYNDETEIYTWAGQELVMVSGDQTKAVFKPRVEGGFATIVRLAADDHQYKWEVREKNGRTTTFGGDITAVNGKDTAHDFQWMQSRVEDANGNWMRYAYTKDSGHLYLDTIDYTLHNDGLAASHYQVKFNNADRDDRRADMRSGFLNKTAKRLKSIDIQFWDSEHSAFTAIRTYDFDYQYTAFGKSQLSGYSEWSDKKYILDSNANQISNPNAKQFYNYVFDYYKVGQADGKLIGLQNPDTWQGSTQETFSTSINGSAGLSGGVKIYYPIELFAVNAGVNISGGSSSTYENAAVFDINGDGITDLIQHNMKEQRILLGDGKGNYAGGDSSGVPGEVWSWINGASTAQSNLDIGINGSMSIVSYPILSAGISHSTNSSDSKWSYMDMDGDGLVDIVNPSSDHYFQNQSSGQIIKFASRSYQGAARMVTPNAPTETTLSGSHLLDPLRMWVAHRRGNIEVSSTLDVAKQDIASTWDGVTANAFIIRDNKTSEPIASAHLTPAVRNAQFPVKTYDVTLGDHVVLQQSSGLMTKDDAINWETKIRYTKLAALSDLTNIRYGFLPINYTTTAALSTSDESLLSTYYTTPDVDLPQTWTLRDDAPGASELAIQYFIARGYFVYQKLSQQEFVDYCARENAYANDPINIGSGKNPVLRSGTTYKYNPLLDQMVLAKTDASTLRKIYNIMTFYDGKTITVHQSKIIPTFADSQTAIDETSGKIVSNQTQTVATNTQSGTVGFVDDSTLSFRTRVLVEKIKHIDGSVSTIFMRPYADAQNHLHVQVQAEGAIHGDFPEDQWIDGTPLSIVASGTKPNYQFTVTGSYQGHDQSKSFTLSYQPMVSVANEIVTQQLGESYTQESLTDAELMAIHDAMDTQALINAKKRFATCYTLLTDGSGNYGLTGVLPSVDDQAFALWAEALAGVVKIPVVRATNLVSQIQSAFTENPSGQFTLNASADKSIVLWAEVLAGLIPLPAFTANFSTGDYTDTTIPATPTTITMAAFYAAHAGVLLSALDTIKYQKIIAALLNYNLTAQVSTDDYLDSTDLIQPAIKDWVQIFTTDPGKLLATISAADYEKVIAAFTSNKQLLKETMDLKAHLSNLLIPDVAAHSSHLIPNLPVSDTQFLFWWELMADVVHLPFLTRNSSNDDFTVASGNETNPALLFYMPTYNLFSFTGVQETINCDSETMFSVQTITQTGAIDEYGFGTRVATGSADVVVLSHFAMDATDKVTQEAPLFIHAFNSKDDLALKQGFDIRENLKFNNPATSDGIDEHKGISIAIPKESIINNFGGGGYNWFYAEWNGYAPNLVVAPYDETRVNRQNVIMNYEEQKDQPIVYSVDVRRDCQVIWPLKWESSRCGNLWHGSINTRQSTEWNGSATVQTTTVDFASISDSTIRSYRLGGDDSIAATKSSIEAGGQLSWIRGSSGDMTTTTVGLAGTVNFTYAAGSSTAEYEVADLDGDRFPDMIKQSGSTISVYPNQGKSPDADTPATPNISFGSAKSYTGLPDFRKFANSGVSIGGSVSSGSSQVIRAVLGPGGKAKDVSLESSGSSSPSFSAGLTVNIGASFKKSELMDINGDGLPDLVSRNGGFINIKLNTGDGFVNAPGFDCSKETSYINKAIGDRYLDINDANVVSTIVGTSQNDLLSFSGNTSGAINVGIGGSVGGVGLNAGIGISVSTDRGYFDLMDLNGDGLPDLVMKDGIRLMVAFNQGDQFMTPVPWGSATPVHVALTDLKVYNASKNAWESAESNSSGINVQSLVSTGIHNDSPLELNEEISSSTTIGFSANGGLSVGTDFPIFAWVTPVVFIPGMINGNIGFNCSIGGGVNVTTIENSYSDMNGDGLPDSVMKSGSGLMVRLNQSGMDGLLKTITLPQGGEIVLDYQHSQNSTDDPNSRFELATVTRNNWKAANQPTPLPVTTVVNKFAYDNGYYDRNDRSFWGYGQVTSIRMDGALPATKQVTSYDNKNYYQKDRAYRVETFDANGYALSRQTTTYRAIQLVPKCYWIQTINQLNTTFADNKELTTATNFKDYDAIGNPTAIEEYQNNVLKHAINISYDPPMATGNHMLAGLPTRLEVLDSNKQTALRLRTGSYDEKGNLKSQSSCWTASTNDCLTTTFTYDSYGNLETETDNAGYKLAYSYDRVVKSYVVGVSDNLGQSTAWAYDYVKSVETSQTDTNQKTITKEYDVFGRMTEVRAPYDMGTTPALHFEYQTSPTSFPWAAITQNKVNYDPTDTQTIVTVILVDGSGQLVQTKKQSVITNPNTMVKTPGWNISPWVVVDKLGREFQKGVPTFDADLTNTGLYAPAIRTSFGGTDLYTENTYDKRDRIVDVRLPDGSHQSTEYLLSTWDSETAWRITSTDPEGKKKRNWISASELIMAVVQDPDGKNLISRFAYDGIGQMLSAKDAGGNSTTIVYDTLGRKKSVDNLDTGLNTYVYDEKGDLIQRVDPVLRSKNLSINYSYDKHRLTQVTLPGSIVRNTYGTDPDANNVGRLIQTENGSVTTKTTYGPMGEALGVQRIIKSQQPSTPDYDNTMHYEYNYLGQMTKITYPENAYSANSVPETVTYQYDGGGQVESVKGSFLGHDVTYVSNIGYDEYGQRVTMRYENGTSTTYVYDPARRWLKSLSTVKDGNIGDLQKLEYIFDKNGNVTQFKDSSMNKTYVQSYSYDSLDQLIGAAGSFENTKFIITQTANYTQNFTYDTIGNMLSKVSTLTRYPAKAEDQKLNYNLAYSYAPDHPHQATQVGDMHYKYDANGNLTTMIPDSEWNGGHGPALQTVTVTTIKDGQDVTNSAIGTNRSSTKPSASTGTRSMAWDYENRLVGVQDGQMSVAYAYDAEGERRLKVQGTQENVYVDRMYEIENSSSNPVASIHVYLGETRLVSKLSILTNPNYYTESDNTYYYHADQLGSSSLITDHNGTEYERMAFTPHGEVWQHDSLDTLDSIDLLFTGKCLDAETGWYYFGARYLDPKTGMWLSGDPALGDYIPRAPLTKEDKEANGKLPGMGGIYNPVNFALYHYAGNNPIKYTDPDGREIFQVTGKYLMTNYGDTNKLGKSTVQINKQGCYVTSMANAADSFNKPKGKADLVLSIANDSSKFDAKALSSFKFREYGMAVFGSKDMGEVKGNKAATAKLEDLKKSTDKYAVFGIFSTAYGDHMVPLNDVATDGSFKDSIVKSGKNDTNWDNRFDSSKLVGIRYFKIENEQPKDDDK